MVILLVILHVIVCLFLIVVVLLQSGKAGDISSAFGGMGSQTAFGPRSGATLLTRATTTSAVLFMLTSLTLTIVSSRQGATSTVIERLSTEPAKDSAAPASTQTTPQFGPSEGGTPAPTLPQGDQPAGNAPTQGGDKQ
ncbi:MAG: preprotein translocase subunit SecG [Bryobacterales bacterium]|jgi:preprotein translocase subunit SecG|nr:preprotein translocase subunit SecG [Bryobacterales bacterium]